jgi:predicted amidohydrolase
MNSQNNKGNNLKRAGELLRDAVERGASLILFPENFSFMGSGEGDKIAVAETTTKGDSIDFLKNAAKAHKVWIAGGTIPLKTDSPHKVTNTLLLFNDRGEVAERYDKIHLFDVNLNEGERYAESRVIEGGKKPVTVQTIYGRLGLTICYDLRFPELYRELVERGAEIFFVPSAFTFTTGKAHWEVLLRARAIENQAYIVAAAQVGEHPGGRRTFGHSMIIDPWGDVIAHVVEGEGIALADIDINTVYEVRGKMPCLTQRRLKITTIV